MGADANKPTGPDLKQGIDVAELKDGDMLAGHVGGEPVLLARRSDRWPVSRGYELTAQRP